MGVHAVGLGGLFRGRFGSQLEMFCKEMQQFLGIP